MVSQPWSPVDATTCDEVFLVSVESNDAVVDNTNTTNPKPVTAESLSSKRHKRNQLDDAESDNRYGDPLAKLSVQRHVDVTIVGLWLRRHHALITRAMQRYRTNESGRVPEFYAIVLSCTLSHIRAKEELAKRTKYACYA